ncbi:MAG: UbiA family prenyltransferase [Candidatus Hodarchaeales archaeon]|jgi:4-hydroxybenzoate polyprenyltransferase
MRAEKLSFLAHMSFYSKFFRARLHIGYLAFPYALFGFGAHWALLEFNLDILFKLDQSAAWWRFIFASIIAFFYMPFLFIINDYFDAPFDELDSEKRQRNPFCSKKFTNLMFAKIFLGFLVIVPFVLGFLISWQAGLVTVIALVLGTFYSAPPFRFKETPIADFLVHGFCLGVYFFSLGFFTFFREEGLPWPFTEPLFLLLLTFSMVDGAWIHLISALKDYNVDKEGGQRTSAVAFGREKTLYSIIGLTLILMLCTPVYFLLNSNYLSKYGIEGTIVLIAILLIIPFSYLIQMYYLKGKIELQRLLTARYRVYVVYPFTILAVFLSNPSLYI